MNRHHYKTGTWVYFEGFDSLRQESKGKHWGMIVTIAGDYRPEYTVVELVDNEYGNEYYYAVREEDIEDAFTTDIIQGIRFAVEEERPYANVLLTRELRYDAQAIRPYQVNGLVPPDSEVNTDSSNSPTEATQERKDISDEN